MNKVTIKMLRMTDNDTGDDYFMTTTSSPALINLSNSFLKFELPKGSRVVTSADDQRYNGKNYNDQYSDNYRNDSKKDTAYLVIRRNFNTDKDDPDEGMVYEACNK